MKIKGGKREKMEVIEGKRKKRALGSMLVIIWTLKPDHRGLKHSKIRMPSFLILSFYISHASNKLLDDIVFNCKIVELSLFFLKQNMLSK